MSQPADAPPGGDPWHAFGYIVSGVAVYGFLGWLADRWLGTTYLVGLGIVTGAVLGIYLTLVRFRPFAPTTGSSPPTPPAPQPPPPAH